MNTEVKTVIWVDLLCLESALKIIRCARKTPIEKIHFMNVTQSFENFVPWLERKAGAPCILVDNAPEGELKSHGMSLYERIQIRLTEILTQWSMQESLASFRHDFCEAHGYNHRKFEAHLKEAAYPHIYKPVEMSVLAEKLYGLDRCILLIRKTPFIRLMQQFLGVPSLHFYRSVISQRLKIKLKRGVYYDNYLNHLYFSDRCGLVGFFVLIWMFNSLIAPFKGQRRSRNNGDRAKIGLELSQGRQHPNSINDLAWFQNSDIDPQHVCALEFFNFDQESLTFVRSLGLRRYKVIQFPFQLIQHLRNLDKNGDGRAVTADILYGIRTGVPALSTLGRCLLWNESAWMHFQSAKYLCRTEFWQSVYQYLGVQMLWTMYDLDDDKLPKGQAIELLGGLSAGGHWSNYPMYHVDIQKSMDVILAWGDHFIKNNFQYSPCRAIFSAGYPCDYYFAMYRESAKRIRGRHEGKFILSYHDNIMANDLAYSKGMQLEIHKMLLSLLRKFENVVVLLKPKRRFVFDEIAEALPELNDFLKTGRLEVFAGDTPRTKAVPAEVAMASDLAIGMGISTAATEAYLAGTVAFHADFTGFERNEFAVQGQGAVVFRDIFTLEKAVIDRIEGRNTKKHSDYRSYYTTLDPFQDGCSAKRTGFLLKRIREYLVQGVDRNVLLEKVRMDYELYVSSMKNFSGMNLN